MSRPSSNANPYGVVDAFLAGERRPLWDVVAASNVTSVFRAVLYQLLQTERYPGAAIAFFAAILSLWETIPERFDHATVKPRFWGQLQLVMPAWHYEP